jgi:uncharacterized membrane protein
MRYFFIDILRFIAIALMVFYHFSFDLNYNRVLSIPIYTHWFWYYLPRFIVLLFLSCVGFSLRLHHEHSIDWRHFWVWIRKLLFFALIISIGTYFAFPHGWIYFGTLHAISTTALMSLPFLRWPKISLIAGLALLVSYYVFKVPMPWIELPHASLDYIPGLPWVGAVLIGFYLHHIKKKLLWINRFHSPFIQWTSIHSLKIYLIHQLILFPLAYLISQVI